jgi:signal transduction histidine kinase
MLMVVAMLAIQALVFLPSLIRARQSWFERRVTEAQLVALTGAAADAAATATRDALLRQAGAEAIWLDQPGGRVGVLAPRAPLPVMAPLDLAAEPLADGAVDAVASLFGRPDRLIAVAAASRPGPGAGITVVLHRAALDHMLVAHERRVGGVSLLIAAAAGVVLYLCLQLLLVRPLRRLTESIAAFRADPERAAPLDLAALAAGGGEIAVAAGELAAMQQELRAALWRNARLAALGTAVAKISHDLRGILTPAMLTAERLQLSADPSIKRAGDVLVRSVERATELVGRTLDFARDAPIALPKAPLSLRAAVEEAAEQARGAGGALAVENAVDAAIEVEADRASLVRVLANLLRNACEAEARHCRLNATVDGAELALTVADDGPGLPDSVRATLFRPFVSGGGGTGLGLAIVRDLMRAHGGDVTMVSSGPAGTCFRLTLPLRRNCSPPRQNSP